MDDDPKQLNAKFTSEVVSAYVASNLVAVSELPSLIASVSAALSSIAGASDKPAHAEKPKPPVSIKRSITPDQLVSVEDGKSYKILKRHPGRTRDDARTVH